MVGNCSELVDEKKAFKSCDVYSFGTVRMNETCISVEVVKHFQPNLWNNMLNFSAFPIVTEMQNRDGISINVNT